MIDCIPRAFMIANNPHSHKMLQSLNCREESDWLSLAVASLRTAGYAIVEGVLNEPFIETTKAALYQTAKLIRSDLDKSTNGQSVEADDLRFMMGYHEHFFKFLEIQEMLQFVDKTLSPSAILRFQNGSIVPPWKEGDYEPANHKFHMNFPRVMGGYTTCIDVVLAITEISISNGAILIVPGTHQRQESPPINYLNWASQPIVCSPGAMVIIDSTLWHREARNQSHSERLWVTHQFSRHYVKQHFDYVRGLGEEKVCKLPVRSQQLLGLNTRLPSNLQEFYVSPEKRLYSVTGD